MTPEEREAVVAIILEQAAITDRNILPDRRGSAGSDYTFGIVKGLKEAAEIVRNHPDASPWIPVGDRYWFDIPSLVLGLDQLMLMDKEDFDQWRNGEHAARWMNRVVRILEWVDRKQGPSPTLPLPAPTEP